jgi:hypothetical protein
MNDNMLYSMATCMGIYVALIKIMEQGQVSNVIRVFHADLPPPAEEVSLYSTSGWTVNLRANGGTRQQKSLLQLLTASRTGGRKICVISINADLTHFEATSEILHKEP